MDPTEQPSKTSAAVDANFEAEVTAPGPQSNITLSSLAPDHKEDEHTTYVEHLETALKDRRNRNIALTGRYGSGKSSILDNFLERLDGQQPRKADGADKRTDEKSRQSGPQAGQHKALRISISTLGPDDDDPDITNRIQKELVKQLLYRVEPGTVLRSGFARSPDPSRGRLIMEPLGVATGLVGLLWLLGVRPNLTSPESDSVLVDVVSVVFLFLLVAASTWALRNYLGNRLISHFSGFGATIEFDKQTDSFFDKYLDEIVEFFDATGINLVVFEDLDRFEDPRIFESLRGLNTLINSSAGWKNRDEPLRFIYAIKDSVFEKLGREVARDRDKPPADPSTAQTRTPESSNPPPKEGQLQKLDAAQLALERANRTKFFELVVPVVPFLSHSNAPDLLSEALKAVGLPKDVKVSRTLVDLVARHTTDMRLMINICNEFAVFGQKLLWGEQRAPGVEADEVFALVVYKNFHPADFEAIPHRQSALDALERQRRTIVSESIRKLQGEKAELPDQDRVQREQEKTALELSERLTSWARIMGNTAHKIKVGPKTYTEDEFSTPSFWRHVARSGSLRLELQPGSRLPAPQPALGKTDLQMLLPEALEAHRWQKRDDDLSRQRELLDIEIAQLRGADFDFLTSRDEFTADARCFREILETALESDLARALVRRGFLTRYYAEYSSVFYGSFAGVEVANFFRNCVWPNEMDAQFEFRSADLIENVLEQAPEDFTESHSVLNIDIVDYLLHHKTSEAAKVAAFIISDTLGKGMAFLNAFLLDTSSHKAKLVAQLTRLPWHGVFEHIADPDTDLQHEVRTELIDSALLVARSVEDYDLDDHMREQLCQLYGSLDSFTSSEHELRSDTTYAFARSVNLTVPLLAPLSVRMRRHFIDDGAYELNADNLRCALGLAPEASITLDAICEDDAVWDRCARDLGLYLDVVKADDHSTYTVLSAEVLGSVIQARRETWTDEELAAVLDLSSPSAAIKEITTLDVEVWSTILHARRMDPTARNVLAYADEIGIDEDLAVFLEESGQLQDLDRLEDEHRLQLVLPVLNSPSMNPTIAVDIVRQLGFSRVDPQQLEPHGNGLLAELIEAQLVPDARETFEHFINAAGWPAVAQAFKVSKNARDFLDPNLIAHIVPDLLEGPSTLNGLKEVVVRQLDQYVPSDDARALRAAGAYARTATIELPLGQIDRIARADSDPADVLWQLDKKRSSLSGDQLMSVLTKIGGEYSDFGEAKGHEFSVPTSHEMHRILVHLEATGHVESGRAKKNRRPVRINA